MKFILTASLIIFTTIFSFAQITLIADDFMTAGDTVGFFNTNVNDIDYHSRGPNLTWDFSELAPINYDVVEAKKISSGGTVISLQFGHYAPPRFNSDYFHPYEALPLEQILGVVNNIPMAPDIPIEGMNRMVKIEEDQITYPGYSIQMGNNQIGIRSDTIEVGFTFPLNYGDIRTSRSRTHFTFSPFFDDAEIIQYRQRLSKVDSYGTLITPYGEFEVVRVYHKIEERDSVRIDLGFFNQWIPINRIIHEYEWWSNKMKRPIFQVEVDELFGNLIVRSASYLDNDYVSVPSYNTIDAKVYPNPATEFIHLIADEIIESVFLYNSIGELVFTDAYNTNDLKIDVSGLSTGIYTLHANSKNNSAIRKIVIN